MYTTVGQQKTTQNRYYNVVSKLAVYACIIRLIEKYGLWVCGIDSLLCLPNMVRINRKVVDPHKMPSSKIETNDLIFPQYFFSLLGVCLQPLGSDLQAKEAGP